jgi:hypothetical protein
MVTCHRVKSFTASVVGSEMEGGWRLDWMLFSHLEEAECHLAGALWAPPTCRLGTCHSSGPSERAVGSQGCREE